MKIKHFLFLGFLLTTGLINAQSDFRPGYIIKTTRDTLLGKIDYRGDLLMGENCRFRIKDKENAINYSPEELIAFRFNESKYFVSKEVNGVKVFLEFLIKGRINIYFHRDEKGDHYFLEKDDSGIIEIPYEEGIKYDEHNTPFFYKSTKHIGLYNYYMQDAPELQLRIAEMGKPERQNLIKLVEDYHKLTCKDSACIIYRKNPPPFKIGMECLVGMVNYQNLEDYTNKNYFQTGFLAHIWMPGISEKLFFRTGVFYSTLESTNSKQTILKIPFQLEYIYPKGVVRPMAAFGINIYKPFYQSVALMGGLNIKLYRSAFLTINYDIDFNHMIGNPFIPVNILSQSVLAGLLIKL